MKISCSWVEEPNSKTRTLKNQGCGTLGEFQSKLIRGLEVLRSMKRTQSVRLFALIAAFFLSGTVNGGLFAQSEATLEQRIKKIMERPEFAHSRFGVEVYSIDSGKSVY